MITESSTPTAVPVTERALVQRINRKLAKDQEWLHRSRAFYDQEGRAHFDVNVGEFYIVNTNRNWLVRPDVDLESLAQELGVLRPGERVAR